MTCILSAVTFGQGLSTINGIVTDPTGAIVPNATINVVEVDTGLSRSTVTNTEGVYNLSSLRPTTYMLTVDAAGFRQTKQSGILLQANASVTINVKLEVGEATQTVNVEASAKQVDTSTATVTQVVDSTRIVELPLNGRNPAQLTTLVAGSVIAPSDQANEGVTKTFPMAITVSTNGGRSNQVSFFLDGAPNIDFLSNVNLPFPMPDALQEFSVQTSNYSAEYGQNSGAVVNIVTKAGTNSFHGDAFEYIRNGYFNARNFFSPSVDPLKRNQFGASLGGPVIHDKFFFFFGYEGTRISDVTGGLSAYVPTPTDLTGDFSALLTANNPNNPLGRAVTVKDPTTGQPFPNNQIPVSRFDPASLGTLNWLPSAGGNGHVIYSEPFAENLNEYTVRGDYNLSSKDRLMVRYFNDGFNQPAQLVSHNLLTYSDYANYLSQNSAIQETHIFNPSLLNELTFAVERETDRRGPPENTPTVAQFGVSITQDSTPAIEGITVSNFFTTGSFPRGQFPRVGFTWSDTLRYQIGRHSISFGGSFERDRLDELAVTNSNGVFTFAGNITGAAITDFMLGRLQTFTQGNGYIEANRYSLPSLFVQDSFKVNSRLTLNGGLRWEPALPMHSLYEEAAAFSPQRYYAGLSSTIYPNSPAGEIFPGDPDTASQSCPCVPSDARARDWFNFGPRVGFAYDPSGDGKTSIRGGAAVFYNSRATGFSNAREQQSTPFSLNVILTQPVGPYSNPYAGGVADPFPAALPPAKNIAFPPPTTVYDDNPSQKRLSPIIYNGNLTIERQLPADTLVRAAYVFTRSTYLGVAEQLNPYVYVPGTTSDQKRVYPNGLAAINLASASANSWYHSLQLTVQKRLSHGFTILGNYTWSKSLDDVPNNSDVVNPVNGSTYAMPPYINGFQAFEYGPSEFDYEQHFSGSYVWNLPGPHSGSALLRNIAGGWELTGIITAQSGGPITVLAGLDRSLTGIGLDRGVLMGQQPYSSGPCANTAPCVDFLNPAAFTLPAYGSFGSIGKGSLRGPGIFDWDMEVVKTFTIRERVMVQLRAEYFNVFNHVNFANPALSVNGAGFGTITSTGSSATAASTADPRIAQLAAKIIF